MAHGQRTLRQPVRKTALSHTQRAVFDPRSSRAPRRTRLARSLYGFSVIIGDTNISVHLDEAARKPGTYNRYNTPRPDPKRPASVKLKLIVGETAWQDDEAGTLESKIASIAAGMVVEGERAYRNHLREIEAQAEHERIETERRRKERLVKANASASGEGHLAGDGLS
jgi:hypothetical protein